jgi:hypothetical protein
LIWHFLGRERGNSNEHDGWIIKNEAHLLNLAELQGNAAPFEVIGLSRNGFYRIKRNLLPRDKIAGGSGKGGKSSTSVTVAPGSDSARIR